MNCQFLMYKFPIRNAFMNPNLKLSMLKSSLRSKSGLVPKLVLRGEDSVKTLLN